MLPLPVDNWEAKGHPGIPDPQNAMIYVGDSEWPRESIPNCKDYTPHTVDGKYPANQLRLVVYPIIYRVSKTSKVVVWDF